MRRRFEPRLGAYLAVGAITLLTGEALRRPSLAAVAVPFVVFVLGGLLSDRPPELSVRIDAEPRRVVEGDKVTVRVAVHSRHPASLVVRPRWPAALGDSSFQAIRVGPDATHLLEATVTARRWGLFALGPVQISARGAWGLVSYAGALGEPAAVRVHPRPEAVPRAVSPRATRPNPGTLVSRASGEGLEYDDVRPLIPGEPVRRVNWRATARTGRVHITQRRLDRAADVVLLLDTFAALRTRFDGTLEQTVRAADALAARHLARGDRVGVVAFGGVVQWLPPTGGHRARALIAETLIQSEITFSYAWKDIRVLPRRGLPAHALVLGITPLLDDRGIRALLDLRARGFDVSAFVIPPFAHIRLGSPRADRLWRLRHDTLRRRLARAGIATASWDGAHPLAVAVDELETCRRAA